MHAVRSIHATALVLAVALLPACHHDADNETTTTTVTSAASPAIADADIAAAVRRRLKEDVTLEAAPLGVSVTNGICTLDGPVGNILVKDRALRVAETLRGVRAVIDRVQVFPTTRTDEQIKHDVIAALHHDSATRKQPVTVTVKDGAVSLAGKATSWPEEKLCTDVAKTADGVRSVENRMTVSSSSVPSEAEIASAAKARIANDIWLDGSTIHVTASGRTVHLKGVVGSLADKARARDDAWLAGAEIVEDDALAVDWAKRDDQRAAADVPYRTDDEIASAVHEALALDPRLRVLVPKVRVQDREVTLTGMVENVKAKRAARLDATNTVGVTSVEDDLVVQPAWRARDSDLNASVERALSRDLFLDGTTIHASTSKGKVVLQGTADSAFDRFDAVEDAASIPGVAEIDDEVTVKRSPAELKTDIEDRIFWDATIERNRVRVAVAPDGTVTLAGRVASESEIRSAVADATAGGASHVVNLLRQGRTTR